MAAAPGSGPRKEAGHFSLLHRDPIVLYALDWELHNPLAALWSVLEALPRQRSYLAVSATSTVEYDWALDLFCSVLRRVRERFEHVEVWALANTMTEFTALQDAGQPAVFCSQNALVREDLYFPIPGRRPAFDAIYDAKWADVKRHHLAGMVQSLALIAYPLAESCTVDYYRMALQAVGHATWFTKPWVEDPHYLSSGEVNDAYNQSRVGLCLSAAEGANFATIQYLLAGLPVVTTRNVGGRDEFFSLRVARWVDDDPEAVAAGVAELVALEIEPELIRAEALEKVGAHRRRFLEWFQRLIEDAAGSPGRWQAGWPRDLKDKLSEPQADVPEVIGLIHQQASSQGVLTQQEVDHFRREGFVIVDRPLVTADEVEVVRTLIDDLVDRFDELPVDLAYDLGDVKTHAGPPQIPEISRALQLVPALSATAAFARCQELAQQLLSDSAFCDYDHVIYKPPREDTDVGWHQDLAFAPELASEDEVHIWFALQDVDESNGCMHYIPASLVNGLLPHRPRTEEAHALVTEAIDPASAVACPLGAGMATVHGVRTPHYSGANTSDETRAAWILHFVDHGA